ncbi:hypothetical protein IX308_000438 [Porphyromonas levii]|uniref:hypothetical protein n=1 Tax=Porphyromonas levii TaxID=28114 RepID=UPI0003636E49|nr:hypothetical protein [Porphyromonas levii]MBR8784269.1 hypothetical protein [Porphyromonas levii]
MKTIYLEIKEQLLRAVSTLRQVSMNTGQLSVGYSENSRPPLAYPSVLIDIEVVQANDITPVSQMCRGRVVATIITDVVNNIDDDRSMAPYDLVAEVYSALQGYSTEHFAPLSRISARRRTPPGGRTLFEYEVIFGVEFIEETAKIGGE